MPKRDKHRKELKRRERVARETEKREKVRRIREFPEFTFTSNQAPAEFVDAIRAACKRIDFSNENEFLPWEISHYRRMKDLGTTKIEIQLQVSPQKAADPVFDEKKLRVARDLAFRGQPRRGNLLAPLHGTSLRSVHVPLRQAPPSRERPARSANGRPARALTRDF